jgi:hypothetical protein
LSRLYSDAEDRAKADASGDSEWRVPIGKIAPEFSVPLLGTDRILTRADLEGRETILLFVSPADADLPAYRQINPVLTSMWETVEGELYLVCNGTRDGCERFIGSGPVKAILDEDGQIARSFQVKKTPRAVHLDEETRVVRYGEPVEPQMLHEGAEELTAS